MHVPVNSAKRLAYAFAGLLAGDAVLLLFFLQNAIRASAALLALHMGQPGREISIIFQLFGLYACVSLVGWLVVELPTAIFFTSRSVTQMPWLTTLFVGAALGPLALLAIFVLFAHGHLHTPGIFAGTGWLWVYSK